VKNPELSARIPTLNKSQRRALATAISLSFKQGFFLIAAIGGEILVAAPSNAAVASVAIKTLETGLFELNEISVLGANTDPSASFLKPRVRGDEFINLTHQIKCARRNPARQNKLRSDFARWLKLGEEEEVDDIARLYPHYNMDSQGGRGTLKRQLKRSKVVFTTLNSAGSNICFTKVHLLDT